MSSKRDDILNATLSLIVEEGLHSITFSKIFKRANVGSGTLYNYFKNKDEIILTLYQTCFNDLTDKVMRDYNVNDNLYKKFRHIIETILKYSITYPDRLVFATDFLYSSHTPEEYKDISNNIIFEELYRILDEGQKDKTIKNLKPELCLSIIFGIILLSVKGTLVKKYELGENEINQIVESCWNSIRI